MIPLPVVSPALTGTVSVVFFNAVKPVGTATLTQLGVGVGVGVGLGVLATQPPFEQCVPAEQDLPHEPQFSLLVSKFISQPSAGLPLQSAKPIGQTSGVGVGVGVGVGACTSNAPMSVPSPPLAFMIAGLSTGRGSPR